MNRTIEYSAHAALSHNNQYSPYDMTIDTPYKAFSAVVKEDWIDYNGHLNVAYYHLIFDLAARPFFNWLGLTPELRQAHNLSTFALENHITYTSEVKVNAEVYVESRLLDLNQKRFHFYQEMYKSDTNILAATFEGIGTMVNMTARKSAPMPEDLYQKVQKIKDAHSALPQPSQIGRIMSINGPIKPD